MSNDPNPDEAQADANATAPGDDELDALMGEGATGDAPTRTSTARKRASPFQQDEPDEDELDALLELSEIVRPAAVRARRPPLPFEEESDHDDELEALMTAQASFQPDTSTAQRQGDHDFADDEEAMRELW